MDKSTRPKTKTSWPPWYNMMILYLKVVICWITWGQLDITDQTLPKDIPCICSPSPTVWDMRHEDQDPGQIHVCPYYHKRCSSTFFPSLTADLPRKLVSHLVANTSTTDWWQQCLIWLKNLAIHNRFGLFCFYLPRQGICQNCQIPWNEFPWIWIILALD